MNNGAKLVICFSEALQECCQAVLMYADVKRSQNKSHASSPMECCTETDGALTAHSSGTMRK